MHFLKRYTCPPHDLKMDLRSLTKASISFEHRNIYKNGSLKINVYASLTNTLHASWVKLISSITDTLETSLSVSACSSWATQMGLFFTLIYIYNSKVNTESRIYPLLQTHWKLPWVFLHVPLGPHRWGCSLHSSISTTVKLVLSKGYISSITDTLETALRVLDHTDGVCSLHSSISTIVKLILSQVYISSITDTLETALSVLDHTDGGCSLHLSFSTTVKFVLSQG